MPDDFKIQLSLKLGKDGPMLNIRADTAYEFHALVADLAELDELSTFFPKKPEAPPEPGRLTPPDRPEEGLVEEPAATEQPKDALAVARERAKARLKQKEA